MKVRVRVRVRFGARRQGRKGVQDVAKLAFKKVFGGRVTMYCGR